MKLTLHLLMVTLFFVRDVALLLPALHRSVLCVWKSCTHAVPVLCVIDVFNAVTYAATFLWVCDPFSAAPSA